MPGPTFSQGAGLFPCTNSKHGEKFYLRHIHYPGGAVGFLRNIVI
jgi:hypothetical protein